MEPQNTKMKDNEQKERDILTQKRIEARIAMENEESRIRRETEEKILEEKANIDKSIEEKERAKKDAEEKLNKEKNDAERKEAEEKNRSSQKFKKELEKIKSVGTQITPIRTFKVDMDTLIKEQSISTARMIMEEESRKKALGDNIPPSRGQKLVITILSMLLIVSGLGLGTYLFITKESIDDTTAETTQPIVIKSLIFSDTRKDFSLANKDKEQVITEISKEIINANLIPGQVLNLSIKNGVNEAKAQEFLRLISRTIPDDLTRSLRSQFMIGKSSTPEGYTGGFIILLTDSYKRAFDGMLKWENGSFVKDIYKMVSGSEPNEILQEKAFEDLIYNNQDTRVLKDENGKIILLYAFLNNTTIAISSELNSFGEILNRFRDVPIQ